VVVVPLYQVLNLQDVNNGKYRHQN